MDEALTPFALRPVGRRQGLLLLVDYQQRLMPAIHGGAQAVAEAIFLARLARLLGLAVMGTEQNPAGLGPNVAALRELCDTTLPKMHFDACRDGLVPALRAAAPQAREVVVAGCEAHVCLLQTVLGLRRAGFNVHVVADACGSRCAQDHGLAMRRLEGAGAVIVGAEMVAFEWLEACTDAQFRPALALIKQRGLG
ncbi:Isochorismatase [Rubrivivax sp. A210]|uniref:isochorismatase family protein n=1 Tax=Rubrivivax sp. A210 TaxID=2772301 RepID=UPI001918B788|nr:isochorismatase family protein [Rubrivivax sp. A210]CAD5372245.1 Isochorismatase [Rubrivivax sp. A210]